MNTDRPRLLASTPLLATLLLTACRPGGAADCAAGAPGCEVRCGGATCIAPEGATPVCRGSTCAFDCAPGTVRCGAGCLPRGQVQWGLGAPSPLAPGLAAAEVYGRDLDGDGAVDLLVLSGWHVHVLLGRGDGSFAPPVLYQTELGSVVADGRLHLGDLNGDGRLDLVVVSPYAGLAVRLGRGDGTFGPEIPHPFLGHTASVLVDADRDGRPDVLLPVEGPVGQPTVLAMARNAGDGTFQRPVPLGTYAWDPEDMATGNLDGDPWPDLVGLTTGLGVVRGGRPGDLPAFVGPDIGSLCVQLGDLTGDGVPDAVATAYSMGSAMFLLYPGDGGGAFGWPTAFPAGISTFTERFLLADLDLDGRLELALPTWDGLDGPAVVAGTLASGLEPVHVGPTRYHGIGVADVNHDGWPDLVLGRRDFPYGLDVALGGCR